MTVTSEQSLKLMSGFPQRLAILGWDVHIVVHSGGRDSGSGVTWHELPMRREPALFDDFVALVRWVFLLATLRPDVVMAGTPKAGLLGMLAAKLTRVRVRIYWLRGLRCSSERGMRRRVLESVEKLTAAAATTVLAVSPSLSREYVSLRLAPRDKVVVLGPGSSNGVDTTQAATSNAEGRLLTRQRLRLADDDFVVGFVGRVTRDKNLPFLLEAVRRLHELGVNIKLLVVGPEEPTGTFTECVTASGIPHHCVIGTGAVDVVEPYYQAMDVLCLPTLREGFPNVVLEAAILEIPTVATRVTGCVDAVVDKVTGILVSAQTSRELTEALIYLAHNSQARILMGRNARTRAVNDFDRHKVWMHISSFLEAQTNVQQSGVSR